MIRAVPGTLYHCNFKFIQWKSHHKRRATLISFLKTKTAIDKVNKYVCCAILDDKLFGYCHSPPRLIVYTMQNDRWETRDTITLVAVFNVGVLV